jgi:hypothetical protein
VLPSGDPPRADTQAGHNRDPHHEPGDNGLTNGANVTINRVVSPVLLQVRARNASTRSSPTAASLCARIFVTSGERTLGADGVAAYVINVVYPKLIRDTLATERAPAAPFGDVRLKLVRGHFRHSPTIRRPLEASLILEVLFQFTVVCGPVHT